MLNDIFNIIKEVLKMNIDFVPEWMSKLDEEDMRFIKKFVLASGSLKEIAKEYNVTYPTIRLRLDKVIQKIELGDSTEKDSYISLIKGLTLEEKLDFETGMMLISQYKKVKEKN